jgi:hypothetical protein
MSFQRANIHTMRDDIHNKAPISSALRALLRQALRPADQQRPDRLRDIAAVALAKELRGSLSVNLLDALARDAQQPNLFGPAAFSLMHSSRIHADVVDHLTEHRGASLQEACEAASCAHIQSLCNESEAAMIAAGGERAQVKVGVEAFRASLMSSVPMATKACIEHSRPDVSNHKVTLSETLPLGKRAQGRIQ